MKNQKTIYFLIAICSTIAIILEICIFVSYRNESNDKKNDEIKEENKDEDNNEVENDKNNEDNQEEDKDEDNNEVENDKNNEDNQEEDKDEVSNEIKIKGSKIDVTNKKVTDSYKKILKTTNIQNSVYKKKKQTFETLDNKTAMLFIAEQIDDISLFEVEKNGEYSYMYSYKLSENVIKDYMKKTFGSVEFDYNKYNQEQGLLKETNDAGGPFFVHIEKKMVDKDNEILPGERMLACKKYQDGMYYFSEFNAGGMESNIQYTKLLNASIDGDYLYIYDEEFKVNYTNGKFVVYLDDETKDESIELEGTYSIETPTKDIRASIGNKIKKYEHTFKKDETGNYYWVSTEQIKG